MTADANGWHSMRSAPKDWSDVLLFVPKLESDWRKVCEGYFDCEDGVWKAPVFGTVKPTRWQPLPADPIQNQPPTGE